MKILSATWLPFSSGLNVLTSWHCLSVLLTHGSDITYHKRSCCMGHVSTWNLFHGYYFSFLWQFHFELISVFLRIKCICVFCSLFPLECHVVRIHPGPCFNIKSPGMRIPIIKMRLSWKPFVVVMGTTILLRRYLYTETAPRALFQHPIRCLKSYIRSCTSLCFKVFVDTLNLASVSTVL